MNSRKSANEATLLRQVRWPMMGRRARDEQPPQVILRRLRRSREGVTTHPNLLHH